MIQSEYGIIIDQTYHTINNTIQEYWVKNTKYEVKFQTSPFSLEKSFEKLFFTTTPLIGEELRQLEN